MYANDILASDQSSRSNISLMLLSSWANQWPFISFSIKYKWLSLAYKVHPKSSGFFVNTFQHEPLTPLRLKSTLSPKHRTNIASWVPWSVLFPSSSPLPLINPPNLQYTLHLNKAMSMIRSHPLLSLIFWIVLFYTLSYFVYYSLRKY